MGHGIDITNMKTVDYWGVRKELYDWLQNEWLSGNRVKAGKILKIRERIELRHTEYQKKINKRKWFNG